MKGTLDDFLQGCIILALVLLLLLVIATEYKQQQLEARLNATCSTPMALTKGEYRA